MKITVDITKEDYQALKRLAKSRKITVNMILSNYVYDLVGNGNGSDERDLANRYFERTGISWIYEQD